MEWNISNHVNFINAFRNWFTGVTGFLCLFGAYNIGSPATIAPFEYVIILWAILISWFLWGETINLKAYIGLYFYNFSRYLYIS